MRKSEHYNSKLRITLVNDVYEDNDICMCDLKFKDVDGLIFFVKDDLICKKRGLERFKEKPKEMYLKDFRRAVEIEIDIQRPVGSKAV